MPDPIYKISGFSNRPQQDLWEMVAQVCPPLAGTNNWARRRLGELNEFVGSVILERDYLCRDHRNLYSHFYSKKFKESSNRCFRLHLFTMDLFSGLPADFPMAQVIAKQKELEETYIGYVVIRPSGMRVIGRSVLNPEKLGKSVGEGYYCLRASFNVHLLGGNLVAKGYPWISQDAEAMVCAHAALWGVCRYLSQRYHVYRELYPYDFINYTSTHSGRTVPYRGMTYSDYSEILAKFGCHPLLMSNVELGGRDFEKLYSYVESGFPVLASTGGHVLVLVGHTLDLRRRPTARGGIIDSSEFVDAFLVVDDNSIPYQKLRRAKKPKQRIMGEWTTGDILHCVVPLPEKTYLPAEKARLVFEQLLGAIAKWKSTPMGPRVKSLMRGNRLVVRQFVTTGAAIKVEARARYEQQNSQIFTSILEIPLPHFVWVMELASLEGYKAGHCFGEIVVDATANEADPDNVLFLRIDGILLRGSVDLRADRNPVRACPQFRNNLGILNSS